MFFQMTSNFIRFLIADMYAFENPSRMNFHFYLNKYKKENVGQNFETIWNKHVILIFDTC